MSKREEWGVLVEGIPLGEGRSTAPPRKLFEVVRRAAAICHLFEKQFDDSIAPLVK